MRRIRRDWTTIVNDPLRLARGMQGKPPRDPRFRAEPHAFGFKPGIDTGHLNQLVDELQADEHARRSSR